MKSIQYFAILMFLVLGHYLNAAHIIGGEMYYSCEGVGNYTFTLNLYRDCASGGADFDGVPNGFPGNIAIYRGNDQNTFRRLSLPAPVISTIDLTTGNPCLNAPSSLCLQQGVYTFFEQLPVSTEPYYVVYQRCCRNPTINNLVDPGDVGGTYSVEITPIAQTTCNNSPRFIGLPPPVICLDEALTYDHSAFDLEGDSIVYSFCTPVNGGTRNNPIPDPALPPPWMPLTYATPYTFDNPMGGNPTVSLDNDGFITGTPNIEGQYVVTVCADEYRNGQLIGGIKREFQFNVTDCIPFIQAQIVSNAIEEDKFILYSCNDLNVPFNDISFPSQNVESFYWEVSIDADSTIQWNAPNSLIAFPSPGIYDGQLIVNPNTQCSDTAFYEVIITPEMAPSFEIDTSICEPSQIQFENNTLIPSVSDITWDFGNGNSSSIENPTSTFEDPGTYPITLTLTDSIGCIETIIDTISYFPIPLNWEIALDSSTTGICPPVDYYFGVQSDFLTNDYAIAWSTGDNQSGTGYQYTHTYQTAGTYDVAVEITSPIGCTDIKTYPAFVDLPFGLFIPNIFSPSLSTINGSFCIQSLCSLTNYELQVFDRYGNIVFRSTDRDACWDGTSDGRFVQAGVYAYRLKYNDEFGEENIIPGDITVVY